MFEGATSFNQDIRTWNVDSDTNFSGMFANATEMINTYKNDQYFGVTPTYQWFTGTT